MSAKVFCVVQASNVYNIILNSLNAELNSICHLLALLAHPILHISRIRVNLDLWEQLKMLAYSASVGN